MHSPSTLSDYLQRREVARDVAPGELSAQDIDEIGRTVFIPNEPKPSDLLFVFGSSNEQWQQVASLFAQRFAPVVLVTGKAGEDYYATGKPQAHRICESLVKLGVPQRAILVEDESSNTLENVRFGKEVLRRDQLAPSSILFVCKSHHAGRAWRTLALSFPNVALRCATYDASYSNVAVQQKDWWQHEVSRGRVYGEYMRIQLYAGRGDIAINGPCPAAD
jgi:uncharacterized SAM-binding protein YcdF (DUF218 family)